MKGYFLIASGQPSGEENIYANKSSLVLDWLLINGVAKDNFAIRDVVKERDVSLGLVQRVFGVLVFNGILQTRGVRTAKKFYLKKPDLLLKSWLSQYSIIKKCKFWTFQTGIQDRKEMLKILKLPRVKDKIALALHSAAEAYGVKNTNLNTLELYLLDPTIKSEIEKLLYLEPQERGYEVLLINPYYKSLLRQSIDSQRMDLPTSSPLLTFLELYHFPLRGQEQAEFMAERMPELKHIYKGC